MSSWHWPDGRVVRVIDGDSLIAELTFTSPPLDVGFGRTSTLVDTGPVKLRLARVNTPPKASTIGAAALHRTSEWLTAGPFHVETTGPYKYGNEWMAELTRDGENLSDLLVAEKLAVYWNGTGPRPDQPQPATTPG